METACTEAYLRCRRGLAHKLIIAPAGCLHVCVGGPPWLAALTHGDRRNTVEHAVLSWGDSSRVFSALQVGCSWTSCGLEMRKSALVFLRAPDPNEQTWMNHVADLTVDCSGLPIDNEDGFVGCRDQIRSEDSGTRQRPS